MSLSPLLPVSRHSVLVSNGHDPDVIVGHLIIDRKRKALHQNATVGSEIRYTHPGIPAQEFQYCAKLAAEFGAGTRKLSILIIHDFLRRPVSRSMKRDSHSMIFPYGTVGNTINSNSHGSYHFTFTLPYDDLGNDEERE